MRCASASGAESSGALEGDAGRRPCLASRPEWQFGENIALFARLTP